MITDTIAAMASAPAWFALLFAVGVANSAHGADAVYEHANDLFGRAVAVDGDWAAVGAIGDNTAAFDAGAIYMYQRTGDTWTLHSRLVPDDSDGDTWLGNALALDGDTLLAGATVFGTNARTGGRGSARVYVRDGEGWREQAVLRLAEDVVEDGFGSAVALAGDDAAVVRDHAIVDGAHVSAAVHMYRRDGAQWLPSTEIALADTGFPRVALAGDTLAVTTGTTDSVALYRRDGDGWTPAGALATDDPSSLDFGEYIAGHGDTLAVSDGARVLLYAGSDATWTLQSTANLLGAGTNLQRDAPLTVHEDRLAVATEDPEARTATVHLFVRDDDAWTADGKVVSDLGATPEQWPDYFGGALAIAGDGLLVGARSAGTPDDEQSGEVHVYRRRGASEWEQTQLLVPAEPPATGCDCRSAPTAPLSLLLLALLRRRRNR